MPGTCAHAHIGRPVCACFLVSVYTILVPTTALSKESSRIVKSQVWIYSIVLAETAPLSLVVVLPMEFSNSVKADSQK